MLDPDVREILEQAFVELVEEVLDDPAWISGEAPQYIAKLRRTAEFLELDFEAVLYQCGGNFAIERLKNLEIGVV